MSLTSLIRSDKELREEIRKAFSRPKLDRNKQLLAEPQTKHYGLVGTAFDYIFRFYLERINNVSNDNKVWIAEQAIELLAHNESVYEIGVEIINSVKELRKTFLKTGDLSEELIRQTLRMSYIDPIFRAGTGIEYIGMDADKADIDDIKKQFGLIEEKQFKAKNICILNPTFGEASRLVGGADADFLIDDKLIDIKTTKKLELKLNDFCQIIGYLLLHKISGINKQKEIVINQLGIYFSRYGYLFLFNVKDLIDDNSLHNFTEWFERRIKSRIC